MTQPYPKAFAIWFEDLDLWSPKSYFEIEWKWADETIKPLSAALKRRQEVINKKKTTFADAPPITLRFDGSMEARDVGRKTSFKGNLFAAHAGDVVYSKIDVRNGAIGIVPESLPLVAVTAEFPIYEVNPELALPEYIQLLFKTDIFRERINSIVSGASGRKRVQPEQLETIKVPFPPLETQRAIVERWREGQAEAGRLEGETRRCEESIPKLIYNLLGTPQPSSSQRFPKAFSLYWEDIERWSVGYIIRAHMGLLGFTHASFPIVPLENVLIETMNGYSIKPVSFQTPYKMLKLNALGVDGLDIAQTKYVRVSKKVAEQFSLLKGDLLICRSVGSFDLVAKCAVVEANHSDILFPDIIIRARLNSAVLPEYVREVMQTPIGRSHFQSNARTAVGMWKIGAEDIRSFPLPLPPLETQQDIVRRVQAVRSEAAGLWEEAAKLRQDTKAEVERLILGNANLCDSALEEAAFG